MTLKQILNKILPIELYNDLRLWRYFNTSNKTLDQAENEINKLYKKRCGSEKNIDWNSPKTYTEKINYSKLYAATLEKTMLTDKIKVRKWVAEKIGEDYLVPLLYVYDSVSGIDFNILPDQFVLKCNHDSGSVIICNNKETFNWKKAKKNLSFYIKRNFAYMTCEMHYKDIRPKIMIEKFMGNNIKDYKFLCFDGIPRFCWIDIDRFGNHKRNIYDMNWNLQPFNQMSYGNTEYSIDKPHKFDEMVDIVKNLCRGFDHVRVDMYLINDKVYFSEMTFTNGSGTEKISPEEWDIELGKYWKLDMSLRDRYSSLRSLRLKDMVIK